MCPISKSYLLGTVLNILYSCFCSSLVKIRHEAADLDARETAFKAKEQQKIQQELKAVKTEIESIVQQFENQLRSADADQFNSLLKKSESAIASIVEAHHPVRENSISGDFYIPQLGEQVQVDVLGNKLATVVEAPGDDEMVLVQYGKIRVRVNIRNIKALANNDSNGRRASVPSSKRQVQGVKYFWT